MEGPDGGDDYVYISPLHPWVNMMNFIIIDPNEIFWHFIISGHYSAGSEWFESMPTTWLWILKIVDKDSKMVVPN